MAWIRAAQAGSGRGQMGGGKAAVAIGVRGGRVVGDAVDALEKGSPTRTGCQMPELISARQQCLDSSALRDQ